ncbi:AAA family ATPase [Xanthomonas campestris]|uniref:AAA family ATPase n=1 Tax=Xanthomonas campestris TaxID=339 RepID=UPI0013052F15|nr:AAA family ATPase [Xanthomonas campestris]MEA9776426.1 AAA family ATPase [Xanthomonas campestris pv. raphani]MEA9918930.1 AAA family ATPase [Xanthomonas campestris pv. raphani]
MTISLTNFSIYGLHGKYDVKIPISDNRLILVGVNGLGKTTVVNAIYFLLTSQWARLLEIDFRSIYVEINEIKITLQRKDIQQKLVASDKYEKIIYRQATRSSFPTRLVHRVLSHPLWNLALDASLAPKVAREIAKDIDVPVSYISKLIDELSAKDDLFEGSRKDPVAIADFLGALRGVGNHQVIYLPTYRRIEQDLKSIFPALDEEDLRKFNFRTDSAAHSRVRGHVELVHFGMQDVEKKIEGELDAIRERTRNQLTNLTATYLQDIIRNRADAVQTHAFRNISDEVVSAVLDRVEENTLSAQDKIEVRQSIHRIRQTGSVVDARDKYLAYFFSRLLDIYFSLRESERGIRGLFDTCNNYLERKILVYDDATFGASIVDQDGSPLTWKMLSSGEKQVASLFTHLFLSGDTEQTVIIDEPELSLSVPWQKSLLPDVVASERCKLLIAVTHSPFIYSNNLDAYAVDLSRCIWPAEG